MQEKRRETHRYRFKWTTTFPLFALFSYSFPVARMRIHASSSSPWKVFFFALPSICFLFLFSLSLSFFFFFISRWNLDERTLLCKAIFNPFWRPFSPSFFESFVPHYPAASRPHPTYFDFTASPLLLHSTLSRTLCLFLSWQSPLIQSRLNYAGFSSGDSARKGGGEKKQNQNRGSAYSVPLTPHIKKRKRKNAELRFFFYHFRSFGDVVAARLTVSFFRPFLIQPTFLRSSFLFLFSVPRPFLSFFRFFFSRLQLSSNTRKMYGKITENSIEIPY